jgi:hypothetical protein
MIQADKDADSETGIWINPYLKKGINGGYFQVGLVVLNNIEKSSDPNVLMGATSDAKARLQLPILLGFNF